jgi:hypothetical protein
MLERIYGAMHASLVLVLEGQGSGISCASRAASATTPVMEPVDLPGLASFRERFRGFWKRFPPFPERRPNLWRRVLRTWPHRTYYFYL